MISFKIRNVTKRYIFPNRAGTFGSLSGYEILTKNGLLIRHLDQGEAEILLKQGNMGNEDFIL